MSELADALVRIAATDTLLVALDFDGTLAPLVDNPEDARATQEAQAAVQRLVELPKTRVALISGRAMASLLQVAEPSDAVLLSGSHGVEARLDSEPTLTLDAAELRAVAKLHQLLEPVAARFAEVWLESKPAGLAMHSRLATEQDSADANRAALVATAPLNGITIRHGSNVLEFSVRPTNKGDGLRRMKEYSGATAVLFAGDDVTDEDAFASLGENDLGIKCGAGETLANYRVSSPNEVATALAKLAQIRESEF